MIRFIWMLFLLIFIKSTFSQSIDIDTPTNEYEIRKLFLSSNTGILEFISIGIGYQVTDDISVALKGSGTWIGSSAMGLPNSGYGLGSKFSYHKPFLFFNSISFEYITYLASTLDWQSRKKESFFKGHYFDFNIGRENIKQNGFNFFWSLGICVSAAEEAHFLVSPSLKGGVNFNF